MSRVSRQILRRLLLTALALAAVFCLAARRCPPRSPPAGTDPPLDQQLPNLPLDYWRHNNATRACAPLPSVFDLHYNNVYWQTVRVGGADAHLLGAYHDARLIDTPTPAVRLVAMADTPTLAAASLHCQLWLEGRDAPAVVPVTRAALLWHATWARGGPRDYHPYMVTCALPPALAAHVPRAVSLVGEPCDRASNMLKVVYRPPAVKRSFAVCVKGLDYLRTDYSLRLVEWIELVRLLGADRVVFYLLQVHPNMARVLDLYREQGLVEVIPLSLPGHQPNHPGLQHAYLESSKARKRFNEVVSFNDCFYRNFRLFDYVVVLDVDEVILPADPLRTWSEMIDAVRAASERNNRTYSSFYARHVYFFDENLDARAARGIPAHLFMSRHVYRAANFTGPTKFVKSFVDTERVVSVHNHLPLSCRGGRRCWYPIPTSVGRLHHYRRDCEKSLWRECGEYKNHSVLDTNIWRYKDDLVTRTLSVIQALGLVDAR